jgi:serine/threonine protein kinase
MIHYPSAKDYNFAVMAFDQSVLSPRFRGGKPKLARNRPFVYSGGFSRVYVVEKENKQIVLRCWTVDLSDLNDRYAKIKDHLDAVKLPYFVEFEYIDECIQVNGQKYPGLYMEWAQGDTLATFLNKHVNNSQLMQNLTHSFLLMIEDMHKHNISHGDLQDANLIIKYQKNKSNPKVDIKLIDYDSVYVPSLAGYKNEIAGIASYQHPKRKQFPQASIKIDYFSELVIYLSLRAYCENPQLWHEGQESRLLFETGDFEKPGQTPIFRELFTLSPEVQHLTKKLIEFSRKTKLEMLQPLEFVVADTIKRTQAVDWNEVIGAQFVGQASDQSDLQWDSVLEEPSISSSQPRLWDDVLENKIWNDVISGHYQSETSKGNSKKKPIRSRYAQPVSIPNSSPTIHQIPSKQRSLLSRVILRSGIILGQISFRTIILITATTLGLFSSIVYLSIFGETGHLQQTTILGITGTIPIIGVTHGIVSKLSSKVLIGNLIVYIVSNCCVILLTTITKFVSPKITEYILTEIEINNYNLENPTFAAITVEEMVAGGALAFFLGWLYLIVRKFQCIRAIIAITIAFVLPLGLLVRLDDPVTPELPYINDPWLVFFGSQVGIAIGLILANVNAKNNHIENSPFLSGRFWNNMFNP